MGVGKNGFAFLPFPIIDRTAVQSTPSLTLPDNHWCHEQGPLRFTKKMCKPFCIRRWEDNIKMDLQEVGGGCGDWMELAQVRERWRALVNTVMNFRVPKVRGIS